MGSPYIIQQNVQFTTSNIFIENGVDIIFTGNYTLSISRNANFGCNVNNINSHSYINIYNNYTSISKSGTIWFINQDNMPQNIKICNTKFYNLFIALMIKFTNINSNFLVNNSIFTDLTKAIYKYEGSHSVFIGHNIFTRNMFPIYLTGETIICNNTFSNNIGNVIIFDKNDGKINQKYNISIQRNIFVNNIGDVLISIMGSLSKLDAIYLENNIFQHNIHYSYLLQLKTSTVYIEYNQFSNNSIVNVSLLWGGLLHFSPINSFSNLFIKHNVFEVNYLNNAYLIDCNYYGSDQFYIFNLEYNNITGNIVEDNDALIRMYIINQYSFCCEDSSPPSIQYNIFKDNIFIDYVVNHNFILSTSTMSDHSIIRYNSFYSNLKTNNIGSYIGIGSCCNTYNMEYNNFYNADNIQYFIYITSTSNYNSILTNFSYFDGLTNASMIANKLYNQCPNDQNIILFVPWFIEPVNINAMDNTLTPKCYWNITHCNDISPNDGWCGTKSPTHSPITFIPTSVRPTFNPSSTPITSNPSSSSTLISSTSVTTISPTSVTTNDASTSPVTLTIITSHNSMASEKSEDAPASGFPLSSLVLWTIIISTIILLMIIFVICCYKKRKKSQLNKEIEISHILLQDMTSKPLDNVINIYNPLVICIGIKFYNNNDEYPNLYDIDIDINNYKKILQNKYGYKLVSNDISKPWTKLELTKYLRDQKKLLINHKYELLYDGIIISISGHGTIGSLICSNNQQFRYKDIRQIFSNTPELVSIPKIYLIDACRTDIDHDIEDQKMNNSEFISRGKTQSPGIKTFSSTIMGTTEGNKVYGGKISKYISKSFKKNYDDFNDINNDNIKWNTFREIRIRAKKNLENDTNNDQTLINNEHDDDIDDIIFIPKKYGRASPAKRQSNETQQVAASNGSGKNSKGISSATNNNSNNSKNK